MKRTKLKMEGDAAKMFFSSPTLLDQKIDSSSSSEPPQLQMNSRQDVNLTDKEAEVIFNKLKAEMNLQLQRTGAKAKRKWRAEELQLLDWAILSICRKKGLTETQLSMKDWEDIASLVPGRTGTQCKYQCSGKEKASKKLPWSGTEDKLLRSIKLNDPSKSWSLIATELNKNSTIERTGKQCRERWRNHLDPELNKDPWTVAEDIMLLEKFLIYGNKWIEISKSIRGRSENNVKNRFNILYKRNREKLNKESSLKMEEVLMHSSGDDHEWVHNMIDLLKNSEESKGPSVISLNPPSNAVESVMSDSSYIPTFGKNLEKDALEEHEKEQELTMKKIEHLYLKNDISEVNIDINPGEYSCPNKRLVNRARERESKIRAEGTRFVNTEINQELFLTPNGIFIQSSKGLVEYESIEQVFQPQPKEITPLDSPSKQTTRYCIHDAPPQYPPQESPLVNCVPTCLIRCNSIKTPSEQSFIRRVSNNSLAFSISEVSNNSKPHIFSDTFSNTTPQCQM